MTDWTALVRAHMRGAADNPARELDIVEELAQHLAQREAEFISLGLDPERARQRVIDELPPWERVAAEIRRADRARPMAPPPPAARRAITFGGFWQDVVHGVRTLRKAPTYTAVALTLLALGIGATTAVFSVVDAVLLRALPYAEPDRIVVVHERDVRRGTTHTSVPTATYLDWHAQQRSFEAMTAVRSQRVEGRDDEGHLVWYMSRLVTREYFDILRAAPTIGRRFTSADEVPGNDGVAIVSHAFWQSRFGGSRDVIGRTLVLNGRQYQIIGVMPRDFACHVVDANAPADLFLPLAFSAAGRERRPGPPAPPRSWTVVARLAPSVSLPQAASAMDQLSASLDAAHPTWAPGARAGVVTLHEHRFGQFASWTLLLFGTAAMVLLIACANVANLMLARGIARRREIALRTALGASRGAIVRALLVESTLLSTGGAALGVLLAWSGVAALRAWLPPELTRVAYVAVDLRVLLAAATWALAVGMGVGLLPALRSSRLDLAAVLTPSGARGTVAGGGLSRLRDGLVVAEVALAVVLVVGAGLFTGSFVRVMRVDVGFDYRNVLTALAQPWSAGGRRQGVPDTLRMLDAVNRIPGVKASAAVSTEILFSGIRFTEAVALPGLAVPDEADAEVGIRAVTPAYRRLLGIPLVRGRFFTDADRVGAEPVVVVNQVAARTFWPGRDAVGQRLLVRGHSRLVVGVVANIRSRGPETPPGAECYLPLLQGTDPGMVILVRTAGPAGASFRAVRAAILSINPDAPPQADPAELERSQDRLIAHRRFSAVVLAVFGVLGLMVSAVGVYGVLAYVVAQRTSEIGVRIALGATRRGVMGLVLGRAGRLVGLGLALGAAVAWSVSSAARGFLFQVEPTEPRIFAVALAVLTLAALAASVIPARRAAAVDPIVALRQD